MYVPEPEYDQFVEPLTVPLPVPPSSSRFPELSSSSTSVPLVGPLCSRLPLSVIVPPPLTAARGRKGAGTRVRRVVRIRRQGRPSSRCPCNPPSRCRSNRPLIVVVTVPEASCAVSVTLAGDRLGVPATGTKNCTPSCGGLVSMYVPAP